MTQSGPWHDAEGVSAESSPRLCWCNSSPPHSAPLVLTLALLWDGAASCSELQGGFVMPVNTHRGCSHCFHFYAPWLVPQRWETLTHWALSTGGESILTSHESRSGQKMSETLNLWSIFPWEIIIIILLITTFLVAVYQLQLNCRYVCPTTWPQCWAPVAGFLLEHAVAPSLPCFCNNIVYLNLLNSVVPSTGGMQNKHGFHGSKS